MGCAGCSTSGCGTVTTDGRVAGCRSNGSCGCNKMNTFDWLSTLELPELDSFDAVEVSFKNGARKGFYGVSSNLKVQTGDLVVVDASAGYDMGRVTLSGELVRLQMKKKKVDMTQALLSVIRRANDRDLERLQEARDSEQETMVRSRVIARELRLDMKIGDVEYQADKRKVTFYYTADGRVDFRELIKIYAKEFRVKIEMRQIGARQESARIGGLGSCGRELCCSTWLSDFQSVSTAAARYQNLAINQSKLSGQCGRLKCCLNYELDTYMEALTAFPKKADYLETKEGTAVLVKTDIFKGVMYYQYRNNKDNRFYALEVAQVHEILDMNKNGKKPADLKNALSENIADKETNVDFEDGTGQIELPASKRKRRRRGKQDINADSSNNRTEGKNKPNSSEKTIEPKQTPNPKPTLVPKQNNRQNPRRNRKDSDKVTNPKTPPSTASPTPPTKQPPAPTPPTANDPNTNNNNNNRRKRNRNRNKGGKNNTNNDNNSAS